MTLLYENKKNKSSLVELEINTKKENIRDLYRGINEFKRGYQPRSNFV
jgi:hypothetical protein